MALDGWGNYRLPRWAKRVGEREEGKQSLIIVERTEETIGWSPSTPRSGEDVIKPYSGLELSNSAVIAGYPILWNYIEIRKQKLIEEL